MNCNLHERERDAEKYPENSEQQDTKWEPAASLFQQSFSNLQTHKWFWLHRLELNNMNEHQQYYSTASNICWSLSLSISLVVLCQCAKELHWNKENGDTTTIWMHRIEWTETTANNNGATGKKSNKQKLNLVSETSYVLTVLPFIHSFTATATVACASVFYAIWIRVFFYSLFPSVFYLFFSPISLIPTVCPLAMSYSYL